MYDVLNSKTQHGAHAPVDLTSAAVQSFSWVLGANARVWRLQALVTTATVSTGGIVLNFRRRPTYGSSSGQSSLGTLTIPAPTAVKNVVYKDITPVNCNAGDEIVVEVTTAAAGGGAAGQAFCDIQCDHNPETAKNESTPFIASV